MNRLFAWSAIAVVVLVGGAALVHWEHQRVQHAYFDGWMNGYQSMRTKAAAALDKVADAYEADCARSVALESTIIAEQAADARQRRQFEHERMLEDMPKTIIIGRKCGQFEYPWMSDCVR